MTKALVFLIGLALAGVAQAQIKCWTGTDGRRACGDLPPPGARLETLRGAPAPKDPVPAATDAKKGTSAPAPTKGLSTSAPQDPESRRRQAQYQKDAIKFDLERAHRTQECERAREMLRAMGGGGRSKRTDAVKARALAEENCGG